MEFNINDLVTKDKKKIAEKPKNPNIGRPKTENPLTKKVSGYLSEEELGQLKAKLSNDSLSMSQYVRKLILDDLKDSATFC